MKHQPKTNNALQEYMSKLMQQHSDSPKVCISPDNARIPLWLKLHDDHGSNSSHNSINSCLSASIRSTASPRSNRARQSRWSNSSPVAMIQAAVELSQVSLEGRSNESNVGFSNGPLLRCVDGISRSRRRHKQELEYSIGVSPLVSFKDDRSVPPPPLDALAPDRWTGKGRSCSSPPSPPCRKSGPCGDKSDKSPDETDRRTLLVRSSRRSSSSRSLIKSKEISRGSNRQLLKRSQSSSSIVGDISHTASAICRDYSMENELSSKTFHTPSNQHHHRHRERDKTKRSANPLLSRQLPDTLRGAPY